MKIAVQRTDVVDFCKRYCIRKLSFFGSVLRDDFGPGSDVDVLVEFEPGHVPGLKFFAIQRELSQILHREVDLNTPGFLSKYFRDRIACLRKPRWRMSRHESDLQFRHMLDHAREAIALLRGKTMADLEGNRQLNLALARLPEIVGEAAARVPLPERERYPDIPWYEIVGLRNRLIHGYDSVDLAILWQTVHQDLPGLVAALEGIVPERN